MVDNNWVLISIVFRIILVGFVIGVVCVYSVHHLVFPIGNNDE